MGVFRESVISLIKENRESGISTILKMFGLDGGSGSGNFSHAGRPGQVGGSAPAGGGGGGGSSESGSESHAPAMQASPKYQKELDESLVKFREADFTERNAMLAERGILPFHIASEEEGWFGENDFWRNSMKKAGYDVGDMDFKKAADYAMARYTLMEKYTNAHGERKYPEKVSEGMPDRLYSDRQKLKAVRYFTGVDEEEAQKMLDGIKAHCTSGQADCEWVDKYIDANGRYEGKIFRWKGYIGEEGKKKLESLVPGAKLSNPHESNWSFSSDNFATVSFGHLWSPDTTTFCYVCDRNITGAPISQYSDHGGEWEVVPHSKTTYTVQNVVEKEYQGQKYYEVHISEDDWQAERGIEPYKPQSASKKHDKNHDYWK